MKEDEKEDAEGMVRWKQGIGLGTLTRESHLNSYYYKWTSTYFVLFWETVAAENCTTKLIILV